MTLVLEGAAAHQEIQLLRFHRPPADTDAGAGTLHRMGFNHVCFRVNDLDAMLAHLAANGVTPRNEVLDYHRRKLVFLDGPGIVVELAEWADESSGRTEGRRRYHEHDASGGMAERTNAQLLKSCEAQASVGSNPTPSAAADRAHLFCVSRARLASRLNRTSTVDRP